MIGGIIFAAIAIIVAVFLIALSLDDEVPALIIGSITAFVITSFCVLVGAEMKDRELNIIIDSRQKEIIYDDNRKLEILQYEVSSKDSCRVKIRAKENAHRRKNEFTNFN